MSSSDSHSPHRRPPSLEELSTRGATTLLLPWILGMASASDSSPREVAVFVHQPSRSITLVESSMDLESVLHEVQSRKGTLPASKASIDSLPLIQVAEPGLECSICLSEFEVNGEERVKEMPCGHQFHGDCIDKWLGIHGSCPLCRFVVAAEEEKKEIRERGGWRIHVFFARGRRGSDPDAGLDLNSNVDMEVDHDDDYDDEEMLVDNDADMENIN